jgi:hypothetical protein
MFQVFQLFQRYVARVSYGCCKSRLGCCICCNGCTLMLQIFVPNVSSVFSDVCCKCVYLDVAYVSHIYFRCFIWMLRTCCNGFQVFQTYVSNVSSFFRHMLQMFHRDVSKVGRVLHMSQWRRWLANSGLPQGFNSHLVPSSHGAPRRLLSLPSLSFPPSRRGSSSSTENPT